MSQGSFCMGRILLIAINIVYLKSLVKLNDCGIIDLVNDGEILKAKINKPLIKMGKLIEEIRGEKNVKMSADEKKYLNGIFEYYEKFTGNIENYTAGKSF